MLNAYEQRLMAFYLANAAAALHHRDREASDLADWVADRENRVAFGRRKRPPSAIRAAAGRRGGGGGRDEGMSGGRWRALGEALREEYAATRKARPGRTGQRLRRLATALGAEVAGAPGAPRRDRGRRRRLSPKRRAVSKRGTRRRPRDSHETVSGKRDAVHPPLRRAAVRTDQIAQQRTRLSNGRIDGRLGNVGYFQQPVRFDGARRIPTRIQGGPAPCLRSWT